MNKTTGPAAELAAKIAEIVPVKDAKVHLASTGSEANDFLVKLIRYRNSAVGETKRKTFITRTNAYHGATLAASSRSR